MVIFPHYFLFWKIKRQLGLNVLSSTIYKIAKEWLVGKQITVFSPLHFCHCFTFQIYIHGYNRINNVY